MQTTTMINETSENNKVVYSQLFDRLKSLHNNLNNDYQKAMTAGNSIPEQITEEEATGMRKVCGSIELRARHYESDLENFEKQVFDFETKANTFASSVIYFLI
jgi:hypothetical protein